MKTAVIKFENSNGEIIPYVDGNFEFKISELIIYTENYIPTREISFPWSVELIQDIQMFRNTEEYLEVLAEQLKNDFLAYLKQQIKS